MQHQFGWWSYFTGFSPGSHFPLSPQELFMVEGQNQINVHQILYSKPRYSKSKKPECQTKAYKLWVSRHREILLNIYSQKSFPCGWYVNVRRF